MSDQTFEQLWRGLKLYSPDLPTPLAKQFINNAYSRALGANRWYGLRDLGEFEIPAPYSTGTVTVVNGSTSVTGVDTVWTSAMEGRQFIIGSQVPFYDIETVTSGTALTLDRAFSGTGAAGSEYSIEYVYLVCPSDFLSFVSVVDPDNKWRFWTGVEQDKLNWRDPSRDVVGTSWVLSPVSPSPDGYPRSEIWPRPSSATHLPFLYYSKPALMSAAADLPIRPFRGDVIREGALGDLAKWPGTTQAPNNYFNLDLHRVHEKQYQELVGRLEVEDQETNPDWITYPGFTDYPWTPIDAKFLQQHDVI